MLHANSRTVSRSVHRKEPEARTSHEVVVKLWIGIDVMEFIE